MGDFFLAPLELLFDAVDDDIDDILLLMAAIKTYIPIFGFCDQRSYSCPLRVSFGLGF